MNDLDQLVKVLQSLGFVDCHGGTWQRKTEGTNLIVKFSVMGDSSVAIWHGVSNITRRYAFSSSPTPLWIELEVCRASLSQLLDLMTYKEY